MPTLPAPAPGAAPRATVAAAPTADRNKYRDELLWQEYARHLYARLGPDLGRSLRAEPPLLLGEHRAALLVVGPAVMDGVVEPGGQPGCAGTRGG